MSSGHGIVPAQQVYARAGKRGLFLQPSRHSNTMFTSFAFTHALATGCHLNIQVACMSNCADLSCDQTYTILTHPRPVNLDTLIVYMST